MTHSVQSAPMPVLSSDQYRGENATASTLTPPAGRRDFSVSEYGKEFDEAAKERMVIGCRQIGHLLTKYASRIRGTCIEFGPFKNPLLVPESFPDCAITFVDGDIEVSQLLRRRYRSNPGVRVITADLNGHHGSLTRRLPASADVFIASQVLNYVDMNLFLEMISRLAAPEALLFVNNVPHYGIPQLFSENRPRDNASVVAELRRRGWTILEESYVPPQFVQQEEERLILLAQAPQRQAQQAQRIRHVQEVQLFSDF